MLRTQIPTTLPGSISRSAQMASTCSSEIPSNAMRAALVILSIGTWYFSATSANFRKISGVTTPQGTCGAMP